jgi:hypothetical protein
MRHGAPLSGKENSGETFQIPLVVNGGAAAPKILTELPDERNKRK